MILFTTLMAGAAITFVAALATFFAAPYVGSLAIGLAVGQLFLAIGVWGLKDIVGLDRIGRAGIVLTSFGYGAFATTTLLAMSAGVADDFSIALTPFYLMAVVFLAPGLAALAYYVARRESLLSQAATVLTALLGVAALLTLLRPFLSAFGPLHAAAGLIGALALGWMAVLWLRRAR